MLVGYILRQHEPEPCADTSETDRNQATKLGIAEALRQRIQDSKCFFEKNDAIEQTVPTDSGG